eukprot:TRINITY_DN16801_c0_g1_i1.p1 TRINITY_DN16801_c0_g1~~TRINITY_DN16801_c0_g1_i1.p1  ORF type:complete len:170 (-),score=29.50 TRINITY_DN16801_c0_g1_i1:285-794(-)
MLPVVQKPLVTSDEHPCIMAASCRSCGGLGDLAMTVVELAEAPEEAVRRVCGLGETFEYRISILCWRRDPGCSWMSTVVDKRRSGNSWAKEDQKIILLTPHGFKVSSLGELGIDGMTDISRLVNVLSLYHFEFDGAGARDLLAHSGLEAWLHMRLPVPRKFAYENLDAM